MAFKPSPPIRIKPTPGGLKIVDGANRTIAYVYTRETETDARHAGLLTQDEGEEVARVIARALTYLVGP